MCDRCKLQFDSHTLTIVLEFFGHEVRLVVHNDTMRHSKAKYYGLDEINRCYGILSSYWGCFDPLGEFVDCYQHVDVPA
jgi:hypothetical protein